MYKIINMYWQRANLHIVVDQKIEDNVYFIRNIEEFKITPQDNEIIINVTNVKKGEMLNPATWRVLCEYNDLVLDSKLLDKLEDYSRIFRYRKEKYAYLVYFSVNNDLHLKIETKFMMENKHPERFYRTNEAKTIKGKTLIPLKRLGVFLFNVYYRLSRVFKVGHNNILFLTDNNDELMWNLKKMHDYLEEQNKNNKYKIKTYSNDKFSGKKNYFKYIYETYLIATSDVIFVDNYVPLLTQIKLSKKTKLVQLWHAGVGFKSVGYARFGIKGSPHPYKSCHRAYTDAVVDKDNLVGIYSEVYGISKDKFKVCGSPRLDGYLSKERIKEKTEELYKKNELFKTSKVILFSPTYRGTGSNSAYYDYNLLDLEKIYNFCEENNFIFIVKMHPFINETISIKEEYQNRIFDYSEMDVNDLIYVSDIMITDYSSCAYEYSLFDRPLIFYRFDKEIYEYERPMHTVDAFTSKQYEVKEFEELMKVLNELKNVKIENRYKNVKDDSNNACSEIEKQVLGDMKL